MTAPLIELKGLQCAVAGVTLVADMNLTVRSGELVELWGPNGSGKSTLLRCMAGLFEYDAGSVEVADDGKLTYLGHRPGLSAMLSPLENLAWFNGINEGSASDDELMAALERVGMHKSADIPCQNLSAGQVRRVALARLAVTDAALWLLDEPLTALDQTGTDIVRSLLTTHRANGGGVICATHQALDLDDTQVVVLGA